MCSLFFLSAAMREFGLFSPSLVRSQCKQVVHMTSQLMIISTCMHHNLQRQPQYLVVHIYSQR